MKIYNSCLPEKLDSECGNGMSTFLPCHSYLEQSRGCPSRKGLALQLASVSSCFIPPFWPLQAIRFPTSGTKRTWR